MSPPRTAAESSYRSLPALPTGITERTRGAVETTAVELVDFLHLVAVDESGTPCPTARLRVSWEVPVDGYRRGGFVEPLGPVPTPLTDAVNGIVVCEGERFSYAGFEARWKDGRWEVAPVPQSEAEELHEPVPEPAAPPVRQPVPSVKGLQGHDFGAAIEGLAAYEPQRTCDPTPKPGTVALRNTLLAAYPGSRNLGIGTGCRAGDVSEHHEGRALDWGVRITTPTEKAMAEDFLAKVFATDAHGNRSALARRMGIMYVIWNRKIWGSYRDDGWRPYSGVSPHTDHVHISMSWAGGMGRTSFWTGTVAANIPTATVLAAAPRAATPTTAPVKRKATTTTVKPSTTSLPLDPELQRELDEQRARRRAERVASSLTTTTVKPTTTTTVRPPTTTTVRPPTTTTVRPPTTTTMRPPTTTTVRRTTTTTVKPTTTTTTTSTVKPTTTTTSTVKPTTTTAAPTTTTTASAGGG